MSDQYVTNNFPTGELVYFIMTNKGNNQLTGETKRLGCNPQAAKAGRRHQQHRSQTLYRR